MIPQKDECVVLWIHGACHLDLLPSLIELGSIFCVASSNLSPRLAYKNALAETQSNRKKKKRIGEIVFTVSKLEKQLVNQQTPSTVLDTTTATWFVTP